MEAQHVLYKDGEPKEENLPEKIYENSSCSF